MGYGAVGTMCFFIGGTYWFVGGLEDLGLAALTLALAQRTG